MANNRGGIPMYNENPQYSATISSQLPQGSPAMFGTQVAKERAGLGDAMTKLGTTVVDWAVKMQEREDNAFILQRDNDMRQQLNELLYNPQTGLANQKGKNAKGVTSTFDEVAEKLTQQFMSDVSNPNMQAKFQERIASWLPGYRKNIAVHEGNERHAVGLQNVDTAISLDISDGVKVGGAAGYNQMWYRAQQSIGDLMYHAGMTEESAREYIKQKTSKAFLAMVDTLSKSGKTQEIRDMLTAGKDKVDGETYEKVKALVGVLDTQDDAVAAVQKLYADPAYWHNGVFNIEKAKSTLNSMKGQNAKTKRLVDGGGKSNQRLWAIAQKTVQYAGGGNPDFLYGQMMHESRLGNDPDALEYNNFAGLHGGAKGRKYANDDEFARDYAAILNNGRYNGWQNAQTATDFVNILKNGGYFTDPNVGGYIRSVDQYGNEGKGSVESYQMPTQGANIDAQVGELKSGWAEQLPLIGGILHSMGMDGVISSAARSAEHNAEVGGSPTSHHINHGQGGDALDIVLPDGTTKADAEKVLAKFKETGAFDEVLFHDAGSGYHLHLGGLKGSLAGQGGGHWEEVSAYNPQWLNAAFAEVDRLGRESVNAKQEKLDGYVQALMENPNVVNAMTNSEIMAEMDKMNIALEDREYVLGRVKYLKENNREVQSYNRSNKQWERTVEHWQEEDNAKNFEHWLVDNMNAPSDTILSQAKAAGVSDHYYIALKRSFGDSDLKGDYAWSKYGANEQTFNDTVAGLKLNSIQKANLRMQINELSKERQASGKAALTEVDIATEVRERASSVLINEGSKRIYGGEEIKDADLWPGMKRTDYGVLMDIPGQGWTTMKPVRDKNGTVIDWEIMNSK